MIIHNTGGDDSPQIPRLRENDCPFNYVLIDTKCKDFRWVNDNCGMDFKEPIRWGFFDRAGITGIKIH